MDRHVELRRVLSLFLAGSVASAEAGRFAPGSGELTRQLAAPSLGAFGGVPPFAEVAAHAAFSDPLGTLREGTALGARLGASSDDYFFPSDKLAVELGVEDGSSEATSSWVEDPFYGMKEDIDWRWGHLDPTQMVQIPMVPSSVSGSPGARVELFWMQTRHGPRLVKRFRMDTADEVRAAQNEVRSMLRFEKSDTFLSFYGLTQTPCTFCEGSEVLVMTEPYSGTLNQFLARNMLKLDIATLTRFLINILEATEALSRRRIPHEAPDSKHVYVVGTIDDVSHNRAVLCSSIANTPAQVCGRRARLRRRLRRQPEPNEWDLVKMKDIERRDVMGIGAILKNLLVAVRTQDEHDFAYSTDRLRTLAEDMTRVPGAEEAREPPTLARALRRAKFIRFGVRTSSRKAEQKAAREATRRSLDLEGQAASTQKAKFAPRPPKAPPSDDQLQTRSRWAPVSEQWTKLRSRFGGETEGEEPQLAPAELSIDSEAEKAAEQRAFWAPIADQWSKWRSTDESPESDLDWVSADSDAAPAGEEKSFWAPVADQWARWRGRRDEAEDEAEPELVRVPISSVVMAPAPDAEAPTAAPRRWRRRLAKFFGKKRSDFGEEEAAAVEAAKAAMVLEEEKKTLVEPEQKNVGLQDRVVDFAARTIASVRQPQPEEAAPSPSAVAKDNARRVDAKPAAEDRNIVEAEVVNGVNAFKNSDEIRQIIDAEIVENELEDDEDESDDDDADDEAAPMSRRSRLRDLAVEKTIGSLGERSKRKAAERDEATVLMAATAPEDSPKWAEARGASEKAAKAKVAAAAKPVFLSSEWVLDKFGGFPVLRILLPAGRLSEAEEDEVLSVLRNSGSQNGEKKQPVAS